MVLTLFSYMNLLTSSIVYAKQVSPILTFLLRHCVYMVTSETRQKYFYKVHLKQNSLNSLQCSLAKLEKHDAFRNDEINFLQCAP